MAHPLDTYLRKLLTIHSSGAGTAETSYYTPLENLLDEIGKTLKPRVRCVMQLADTGAGLPDGGLFSSEQFKRANDPAPAAGQLPSRAAIEVKPPSGDVRKIAKGAQTQRYLARYGLVLVTTLRDFVLVGADDGGKPKLLEAYTLAADEQGFWEAARSRKATIETHGARLEEFLKRVMLHGARLTSPADVAWFLASYARDARLRIDSAGVEALEALRRALEDALGLKFEGQKGEHFFRSTLVQTLFYGVFSAWVLWGRERPNQSTDRFRWHDTPWFLRVPMIRALFEQVAAPSKLKPLGIEEVLDWAETALNRVDRQLFYSRFEDRYAVQYFYEPFLKAFDPELRKQLGVWFTPPEVVQYMVARVNAVLREELRIEDGLADERVLVLDPCTGTGSYLLEVLRHIERALAEKSGAALAAHDVKRAAIERVFGFEILPAPFVVAHLQLGLYLQQLGAPLMEERDERASVYLTNALTGWEQPHAPQQRLAFPELEEERDASEHVKRDKKILVVLGNPPYNGFAGVAVEEERSLTQAYKKALRTKQPQGQGLNDLFVRFFRVAERRIAEISGEGIVCFISNYSWLDGLSFTAMRERYLDAFDKVWVDCLNGDKYKTGKLTPDGAPDPSVFSTEWNREGIQVGTAITLMARKRDHRPPQHVHFRDFWGVSKRADLLAAAPDTSSYAGVEPSVALGLPYVAAATAAGYSAWPSMVDLFPLSFPGVKTSRDDFLVDPDRDSLVRRIERYFDPNVSHQQMRLDYPALMKNTSRYEAELIRDRLRRRGVLPTNIVRYCYRPFDVRWLYWEPDEKLLDEKREEYFPQVSRPNIWLEARQHQTMARFDRGYVTRCLADNFGNGLSSFFPLYLKSNGGQPSLFDSIEEVGIKPNLSVHAREYLQSLATAEHDLFHHCAAILRAPAFCAENGAALRQDWPRIPLPAMQSALAGSSDLGKAIAALMDPDRSINGVTSGTIRPELKAVAVARAGASGLDLSVTAGWGHGGRGEATMPGRGRTIDRPYDTEELAAIAAGAAARGLARVQMLRLLGEGTFDIYLNDTTYWSNIPSAVWGYTLAGYQVLKKVAFLP